MNKINFTQIKFENNFLKKRLLNNLNSVFKHGNFILGKEIIELEKKVAMLSKTKYAVCVSSGTSALYLSLKALGIKKGDHVITVAMTYLTTVSSIVLAGATPVIVDVDKTMNMCVEDLKKKITNKTKAIIVVHLTGNPSNIDKIKKIADTKRIKLIEDCAQSIGSKFKDKPVGSFGDTGCFSFHPLKNLGTLGDGGMIVTNSKKLFNYLIIARNNGHPNRDECDFWSFNMRMDTIHASFLITKIKYLNEWIKKRRKNANIYHKKLKKLPLILPEVNRYEFHTYHLFVIRTKYRNELMDFLKRRGIETKIHYPIPINKMRSFKQSKFHVKNLINTNNFAKEILSIPINQYLKEKEINFIVKTIKDFFHKKN